MMHIAEIIKEKQRVLKLLFLLRTCTPKEYITTIARDR